MMNPIVKELIVLQVIYALIVPQVQEVDVKDINSHSSGSGSNSGSNDSDGGSHSGSNGSSHSGSISESPFIYSSTVENKVISSNIKLSLVKITNEIQNSLLVNELMDINHEAKLTIKDILGVIKDLFPLQRTILIDGQLSFHNLKIKDLKNLIVVKYDEFKENQIKMINEYDTQLLKLMPTNMKHPSMPVGGKRGSSAGSSTGSTRSTTPGIGSTYPGTAQNAMNTSLQSSANTTTAPGAGNTAGTVVNKDPKREKLLQLYRDTVLNKLQSKTKILDRLYMNLNPQESEKIVNHLLELEKIKTTTPASVHNLQLILQKSASDGIMSSRTGSLTWQIARQVQAELDDTVQFMRRALE